MPLVWKPKGVNIVGNTDPNLSPYLKVWIKQKNTVVCGKIGEGTTKDLQANWESPFEQDSAGSVMERPGGLLQLGVAERFGVDKGTTSKTTLNSAQVWSGNRPFSTNLVVNFDALWDAKKEVEDAITALEEFASPDVNSNIPVNLGEGSLFNGRIPEEVTLNVGRNFIWPNCVIESISDPLDGIRDKNGYRLSSQVTLTVQTARMINRSQIKSMRG